jgi:DNA-binding CsgD family transcriptional regulator
MKIFHHNQLIHKVVKDLKALKLYVSRDGDKKNSINRLQYMINDMNYSNNNNNWKEFETIFIESNPGYLEKLHSKYPNLTSNEIKLCVFLYLNMRTKDISSITQQSIKSVNVARTRLRKKLHLENTNANLSSFLQQIK